MLAKKGPVSKADKRASDKVAKASDEWAKFRDKLTYKQLVEELADESKIDGRATRLVLAETIAAMRFELQLLMGKQRKEELRAEEVRALPALASNMRRLLESLGNTEKADDDWEF